MLFKVVENSITPLPLPATVQDLEQHVVDHAIYRNTVCCLSKYLPDLKSRLILDIGCGLRVPQSIQFHSCGYRIVGIDMDIPVLCQLRANPLNLLYPSSYRRIREEFQRNMRYYQGLQSLLGVRLKFLTLKIRKMAAEKLEFPDAYFDAVISNAAFEHILPIEKAFSEMRRVMKKGAIGYIGVHLFPSLSGSHCTAWQNPGSFIPKDNAPWAHLRTKDFAVPGITLNRLRERDYKDLFSRYFTILEWNVPKDEEGRELLTAKIKGELKDFTEEELLRRWILVVFRK